MNIVSLIGRVGKVEPRTTPSGSKVAYIALAVDRRTKDRGKETDWIDLTAWGKTADFAEAYIKKGERIGVQGSLQTRTWETEDGQKRKTSFVLVDKVDLLGGTKTEPTNQVDNENVINPAPAPKPEPKPEPNTQSGEQFQLPFEL